MQIMPEERCFVRRCAMSFKREHTEAILVCNFAGLNLSRIERTITSLAITNMAKNNSWIVVLCNRIMHRGPVQVSVASTIRYGLHICMR